MYCSTVQILVYISTVYYWNRLWCTAPLLWPTTLICPNVKGVKGKSDVLTDPVMWTNTRLDKRSWVGKVNVKLVFSVVQQNGERLFYMLFECLELPWRHKSGSGGLLHWLTEDQKDLVKNFHFTWLLLQRCAWSRRGASCGGRIQLRPTPCWRASDWQAERGVGWWRKGRGARKQPWRHPRRSRGCCGSGWRGWHVYFRSGPVWGSRWIGHWDTWSYCRRVAWDSS